MLTESRRADFVYLCDALDLTDGNLYRHLQVLETSGYVQIEKTLDGRRPRTWIAAAPHRTEGGTEGVWLTVSAP